MPPRKRVEAAPDPSDAAALPAQGPDPDEPSEPLAPAMKAAPKAKAEQPPCPECMPEGWPETATAMGCEHGNWERR
jgi:hypothetical protein